MLKPLTEVQGVFYWGGGDEWRAINREDTTSCSGSPWSHKQLEAEQKHRCYYPVLKASPGIGCCWRLSTARGTAVLPKIVVFTFLFLLPEATGSQDESLMGRRWAPSQAGGKRMQQETGVLSWEVLPFPSILCSASIQNILKTSIIFKYPQTWVK